MPFKALHLAQIELQGAQTFGGKSREIGEALERSFAFSGIDNDIVLGCAGIVPLWEGRAHLWSYLSKNINKTQMIAIHRAALRGIEMRTEKRLEATCDVNFKAGHRWLKMLGFQMECERMRSYRPDGGDEALYSRIR